MGFTIFINLIKEHPHVGLFSIEHIAFSQAGTTCFCNGCVILQPYSPSSCIFGLLVALESSEAFRKSKSSQLQQCY